MSLSKTMYDLIKHTQLVNEKQKELYFKLLELKIQFPVYLQNFNKKCIVNYVKIKEIEKSTKWFSIEIIDPFGAIFYLNIPENLTKLKSIEYEYMRQELLKCKSKDNVLELLNLENNIHKLYSKRISKDKELKLFLKQYCN